LHSILFGFSDADTEKPKTGTLDLKWNTGGKDRRRDLEAQLLERLFC